MNRPARFSYPEVGATRHPEHLPAGYRHLRHRTLIGYGREVLEAAGETVTTWRMHRGMGTVVRAEAERADPGVRASLGLGLGPLTVSAPAEVIWSVREPDRIGFAYGTLTGHPAAGEESFVVEMRADRAVWLTVTSFSRPDRWWCRLGGPLLGICQALYVRGCGRVVRRAAGGPDGDGSRVAGSGFNHPEVGAVARPDRLPAGYHHLRHRALIGHGRSVLEAAGETVLGWRMHRGAGIRVDPGTPPAEAGVRVVCRIGAGPLRVTAPAEVLWAVREPDRIGFAYGTLTGHPEAGEESFVLTLGPDGAVWLTITAFSRPGRWYTRLAGPVVPLLQRVAARRYAQAVRRSVDPTA
ncbi:DUF1990 family protein [Kitasatospora sp. NPDC096147]|uniref:DUF1990 family protein n=1 Tax=Kitasatospora sp. NPDC096147 TaxID=3364093 RepID=UPI0038175D5A